MTASSPAPTTRDRGIDTLRGLAVLGLVVFHAMPQRTVAQDGWTWNAVGWQALNLPLMPLFAAIAGYVYALRPLRQAGVRRFIRNKAARVLVPFATATLLLYTTRLAIGGFDLSALPWSHLRDAFLLGSDPEVGEHLWFLPALLIVFAVVGAMDVARLLDRPPVWAGVCLGAWIGLPYVQGPDAVWLRFGALWGGVYLLPAFLLGYGVQRHRRLMHDPRVLAAAAVIALGTGVWLVSRWGPPGGTYTNQRLAPLAAWCCVPMCLLMLRARCTVTPLAWLGGYSYGIYLYHGLGLALHTRLDHLTGERFSFVSIPARTANAVAVPMAFELAARRVPWASAVCFGTRRKRAVDDTGRG